MKPPIFIVGTGRSGTHFVCSTLIAHPEITDLTNGKENRIVFRAVTDSALNMRQLSPETIFKYKALRLLSFNAHYIDQSHPNLWHVEQLLKVFPNAKFIGIVRCPFSVTYSMLNHVGVRNHFNNYMNYPSPNQFFGINQVNANEYHSLSASSKCALRWCSHMHRLDTVCRAHPSSFLIVNYEQLCLQPRSTLDELRNYIGLKSEIPVPIVRNDSLYKKYNLSSSERTNVQETVESYFKSNPIPDQSLVPLREYLKDQSNLT